MNTYLYVVYRRVDKSRTDDATLELPSPRVNLEFATLDTSNKSQKRGVCVCHILYMFVLYIYIYMYICICNSCTYHIPTSNLVAHFLCAAGKKVLGQLVLSIAGTLAVFGGFRAELLVKKPRIFGCASRST